MSQSYLKKQDYQAYIGIVIVVLSIFTFNTLNNSHWDLNTPFHNIDIKFLGSERAEKNNAVAVLVLGVCLQKFKEHTDQKHIDFEFRKDFWPDSIIEVKSKAESGSVKLALSFAYKELRWRYTKNKMIQKQKNDNKYYEKH